MKRAFNFLFVTTKAGFFLLAALLWSGVMYFVNNHYQITWEEIFVEADGMVFDLIVFGVVLTIYEAYREIKEKNERTVRERNEKIERLHEEIDDYRGWDEKEAMYRIVGAIRRLNKLGVSNINLSSCYLVLAQLDNVNLQNANLSHANLYGAKFHNAHLEGAELRGANLNAIHLDNSHLNGAILRGANMNGAHLWQACLEGANLDSADLFNADIAMAELEGALVKKGWFEKLEKWNITDWEELKEKYRIDENGKLQLK